MADVEEQLNPSQENSNLQHGVVSERQVGNANTLTVGEKCWRIGCRVISIVTGIVIIVGGGLIILYANQSKSLGSPIDQGGVVGPPGTYGSYTGSPAFLGNENYINP